LGDNQKENSWVTLHKHSLIKTIFRKLKITSSYVKELQSVFREFADLLRIKISKIKPTVSGIIGAGLGLNL